ncbi:hypothetical protein T492DRAFT_913263, partial [Pavlovales sp. CCMP2436]
MRRGPTNHRGDEIDPGVALAVTLTWLRGGQYMDAARIHRLKVCVLLHPGARPPATLATPFPRTHTHARTQPRPLPPPPFTPRHTHTHARTHSRHRCRP